MLISSRAWADTARNAVGSTQAGLGQQDSARADGAGGPKVGEAGALQTAGSATGAAPNSPLMGGRLPLTCPARSPLLPSPGRPSKPGCDAGRVGDRLPSRDGEMSRDDTLLGGADSTCGALARARAAGATCAGGGSGADDCRSSRWIASVAAWLAVERGETLLLVHVGEAAAAASACCTAAARPPPAVGAEPGAPGGAMNGLARVSGSAARLASERGRSSSEA